MTLPDQKCGPWTLSIHTAWELEKNTKSQASPPTPLNQHLHFNKTTDEYLAGSELRSALLENFWKKKMPSIRKLSSRAVDDQNSPTFLPLLPPRDGVSVPFS